MISTQSYIYQLKTAEYNATQNTYQKSIRRKTASIFTYQNMPIVQPIYT